MTNTRMRCALGACMLSSALLIGSGGAIASADTGADASSSTAQNQGSGASQADTGTGTVDRPGAVHRPITEFGAAVRGTLRSTVRDVKRTLGSLSDGPRTRVGNDPVSPTVVKDSLEKSVDLDDVADVAAEPESVPADVVETAVVAPVPVAQVTPAPSSGGSSVATELANSNNTPPAATAPGPKTSHGPRHGPWSKLPAAMSTVTDAMTTVAESTRQTVTAVPTLLMRLPTSTTPIQDVIATIEYMITSVGTGVSAIADLPTNLVTLMGVSQVPTSVVAGGTAPLRPISEARPARRASAPWTPAATAAPLGWGSTVAAPTAPSVLTGDRTVSVSKQSAVAAAPLSMSGVTASGAPSSLLDRAVTSILLPLSLAALAAVALPGVGGLLVICALGIRIGYRQAKAGWAVHVAGIGRFAGPGPLGVVRSGSMIALHKRTAPVATVRAARFLDQPAEQAA